MQLSFKTNGTKIGLELISVTLGILIALAIDSAYDSYQDKQKAQDFLQRAEVELIKNKPTIEKLTQINDAIIAQALSYQAVIESAIEENKKAKITGSINSHYQTLEFDTWQLSQHRSELQELPVGLLSRIGKAYSSSLTFNKSIRRTIETISDIAHANTYVAKTLNDQLANAEHMVNKLKFLKLDLTMANMHNEFALKAIYEYSPMIKEKRDKEVLVANIREKAPLHAK